MITLNTIASFFILTFQSAWASFKLLAIFITLNFVTTPLEKSFAVSSLSSTVVNKISRSPALAAFEDFKFDFKQFNKINTKEPSALKVHWLASGHTKNILQIVSQSPKVLLAMNSSTNRPHKNNSISHRMKNAEKNAETRVAVKKSPFSRDSHQSFDEMVRTQVLKPVVETIVSRRLDQLIEKTINPNKINKSTSSTSATLGQITKPLVSASFFPLPAGGSKKFTKKLNVIRGQVQITSGLAYTEPNNDLKVFRVMNEQEMEVAKISYQDGSFQIGVREKQGHLLAELRDKSGQLLGYGAHSLNQNIQDKVHIKISPVSTGTPVTLLSARSFKNVEYSVENPQVFVDRLGIQLAPLNSQDFESDDMAFGSNYILRSEAKGYWSSLTVGVSGERTVLRMHPASYIQAQLDFIGVNKNVAVISGRVVDDKGRPLRGVEVKLVDQSNLLPTYFNQIHFPDTGLVSTSENGLFAFIDVPIGLQAVQVIYKDSFLSVQVLPAEEGVVSYIEIQGSRPSNSQVIVYDGVNQETIGAALQVYGMDRVHDLTGVGFESLEFPGNKGVMLLEVDPGEGFPIFNYMINRNRRTLHLPVASEQWLNEISETIGRPKIVGFVSQGDYLVQLAELDNDYKVIYFDSKGNRTPNSVAHGGFVIVGSIRGGLNTVVLQLSDGQILTQLCAVNESSVSAFAVAE